MKQLFEDFYNIGARIEIPAFLKKYNMTHHLVEVGVRYGYFLRQLLSCDPDLLMAVDHWGSGHDSAENDTQLTQDATNKIYEGLFNQFMWDSRVRLFRGYSKDAVRAVPDMSLDFVYIDADHTKQGCLKDMGCWWRKVRQGGLFAGHDYIEDSAVSGDEFGVIDAVQSFMKDKKIPVELFHNTLYGYRTWMILKLDGE